MKKAREKEVAVIEDQSSITGKRKRNGKSTPISEARSIIEEKGGKIDDLVFLRQNDSGLIYLVALVLNQCIDPESDQTQVALEMV